jgi:hypothetical protein
MEGKHKVTYQNQGIVTGPHCGRDSSPEDCEIEITPEMVEAGYRVFVAAPVTDDPLEADKLLVSEIYRAMRLSSHAFKESPFSRLVVNNQNILQIRE